VSFEIDDPPEAASWGLHWINWITNWFKRTTKVIDLTGLTDSEDDYRLAIGEVVRIDIAEASTLLRIAVEDGVYELDLSFDDSTFGADRDIVLNANNTTYTAEFRRIRIAGDTALATDEVDTSNGDDDYFIFATTCRARHIHARLIIYGNISNMVVTSNVVDAGSKRLNITASSWVGSDPHSSLGTLSIGEAATGVCYVKRIA
jgi:hypothetical protein